MVHRKVLIMCLVFFALLFIGEARACYWKQVNCGIMRTTSVPGSCAPDYSSAKTRLLLTGDIFNYCSDISCGSQTKDCWEGLLCYWNAETYGPRENCANGDDCKIAWGYSCGDTFTGRWDATSRTCVECSGGRKVGRYDRNCNHQNFENAPCESACGANAGCDEKFPGEYCGTNGRCTYGCFCCEASDYDNGINYNVKGTATGPRLEGGEYICKTETDSCIDSKTVKEWYIDYLRFLVYREYSCTCKNQQAGCCYDGRCVECITDGDCPAKNNIKGKCDTSTNTCYWPPCRMNEDCVAGACCVTPDQDTNVANQGKCVSQGIYSNNPKWLCGPP